METEQVKQTIQSNKGLIDLVFKGFVTLSLFLGKGIMDDVSTIQDTQNAINISLSNMIIERDHYEKDIDKIEKILEVPRFTKEDFDLETAPIIKQLNANTSELNNRSTYMESVNEKLIRLEIKIENLEKK